MSAPIGSTRFPRPTGLSPPGDHLRDVGPDGLPFGAPGGLLGGVPRERAGGHAGGARHHADHGAPHSGADFPGRPGHAEVAAGVRQGPHCGGTRRVAGPLVGGRLRHLQHTATLRGGLRAGGTAYPAADLHVLAFPATAVPEPGQAAGRRAHPGRGAWASCLAVLLQLARNIDHYSPAEAARLSAAALEILAAAAGHELDVTDWGTPEAAGMPADGRSGLHPASTWAILAVTGRCRRRPSHLPARPAPALPRRGPDGGGLDPAPAPGALPP